jgi:hypothetical protein
MRASTDRRFTLKCAELRAGHVRTIPEPASDLFDSLAEKGELAEQWEEEPPCAVHKDPDRERGEHECRDQ